MASFWSQNFDYLYFVYGLSFVLLASICIILRRADRTIAWQWLGLFGIVHGINEWLDMLAISVGDSFYFKLTRLVIMALSYVFLLEFARRWYNRNRPAIAAYWYIFPLLILLAIGFVDRNINWFNAASRYVLGFAGSLLAGFVLLKTACPADCKRRFGVILAAGSFLTYALATGLVVPKAAIFPATCLNYDSFFAVCGFPVQLIRMLCALTAMTGLWLYLPRPVNETASQRILHKLVSPAIFIIVILLGWFATEWRGKSLDSDLRDRLLMDTMSIAGTISPEQVKQLSFTSADKENPIFERIREQMIAHGRFIHQRSIYSMAIRDGQIVFGPENLSENDPMASPPGTGYIEPSQADWDIFKTGQPTTIGPQKDEYGTYFSAQAPISDPHTGKVLMAIGMDVPADKWVAQIAIVRLYPILGTLILVTILLGGISAIQWRNYLPTERQKQLRHLETILVAACALVVIIAVTTVTTLTENRERRIIFDQMGSSYAGKVRDVFFSLKNDLASIIRFYEGSNHVDGNEFRAFAGPVAENAAVQALEWVQFVPAARKELIEADAIKDGVAGFAIWEKDANNGNFPARSRPAYYPVYFAEPAPGNEKALGYDLGSEPVRFAAIRKAIHTGLITATAPITLVQKTGKQESILVFQPLISSKYPDTQTDNGNKNVEGFALGVIRLQSMLENCLADSIHMDQISIRLVDLTETENPKLLAVYPPAQTDKSAVDMSCSKESQPKNIYPLFFFGRTYALVANPSRQFYLVHSSITQWLVGLGGIFLSAVLTAFVGFLRNRQIVLEQQVLQRTADLHQSNEHLKNVTAHATEMADRAEKASTAKSEFLANMSHELRTPLHSIISFAGFGVKKYAAAEKEKLQDYFLKIQKSGKALLEMVNNLLDLAKIESGKMCFDFARADLNDLASQVLDEFEFLISERKITVQCHKSDLELQALLDPEKIKQVIRNLLSNAVKFSPVGGIIEIDMSYDDKAIIFSIKDQGPGIPEDEIEIVFEKFMQSSKTKSGAGGTGLGLAICKEIVEAHNGQIAATNNSCGGSTFIFTIPLPSDPEPDEISLTAAEVSH